MLAQCNGSFHYNGACSDLNENVCPPDSYVCKLRLQMIELFGKDWGVAFWS